MTTYIALLRAVNLAGYQKVAMAELRQMLAGLDFSNPRSVLQSGNLLFESDEGKTADLERRLETEAARRLGLSTDFFVRTASEWRRLIDRNPFPDEARRDPAHLLVLVAKTAPTAAATRGLQAAITGREVVRADGRQIYAIYPDGIGRSKLTTGVIEKALRTRVTGRNWNTVLRLAAG